MSGAAKTKPAGEAGFNEKAVKSLYSKNLAQLYRRVNSLCKKWSMSRVDFERAACVYSLMFRDHAPRDVQIMFTGKPSLYSERTKTLALTFFLAYAEAEERIQALGAGDDLDAAACWNIAINLAGGTP